MGLVSLVSIVLAGFLVDIKAEKFTVILKRILVFPCQISDSLIFWIGFGIDGVFTVTIVLMWAEILSHNSKSLALQYPQSDG